MYIRQGGYVRVGIRELRADLSSWVRRANSGEEVIVTDRGASVARLVAPGASGVLDRLIAEGVVLPGPGRSETPWRPASRIVVDGGISDLVAEQRS